jgi:hypothetical protein
MNTVIMLIIVLITCILKVFSWLWISMSSHIASTPRSCEGITYPTVLQKLKFLAHSELILGSSFFLLSKEALISFCLRIVHNISLYVFEHFSLGQYCSKHINMMCLPCQCTAVFSQTVLHQTYVWAAFVYNISDTMKGRSDVGDIFLSITFKMKCGLLQCKTLSVLQYHLLQISGITCIYSHMYCA